MKLFFKKYNINILLFILVTSIAYLSFYNYKVQNNLLLEQMQNDTKDVANSISASMKHFNDIKSTVSIQKLVSDLSFGLEIFDFRFMRSDGVIKNSIFKDEIGQINSSNSFMKVLQGDLELKSFFFDERDFVKVMAIYYPIYKDNDLKGIIDLSVEISEQKELTQLNKKIALQQRKIDIGNLLKSIEGSIINNLTVIQETDMNSFLKSHVKFAPNVVEISVVDIDKKIIFSSDENLISKIFKTNDTQSIGIFTLNNKLFYRTMINTYNNNKLVLLINASVYEKNEQELLRTALTTSAIALFLALLIARAMYNSAIERSHIEKERLEHLVKERTHEIELLSKIDGLTSLWNRSYLEEMLDMEFKRARRYNHDISIMVIDLDNFKSVNDTYGHLGGDEVLRQISKRIKESVRDTDFVGRFGGEEIVVILPETPVQECENIANKVLQSISAKPVLFNSQTISITASIGVSRLDEAHKDQKALFYEADLALYQAKKDGKNRVILFDKEIES